MFAGVLLGHQRLDLGFDGAGTNTHDKGGDDDQATKESVGVLESGRVPVRSM